MDYNEDREDGPKTTQALSTEISPAYQTTERPKNVKIEIGKIYTLDAGSMGTQEVTIVSIRQLRNNVVIYYKYKKQDGKWYATYINNQCTIETFRAQLLAFGELKSIDLLYPSGAEKDNYYPSNK